MHRTFFPRTDAALVAWGAAFTQRVVAEGPALDLPALQVAELAARYEAFAEAQRRAVDPTSRTTPALKHRAATRDAFKETARKLSLRIKGHVAITDSQLVSFGLHVKKQPTRIAAPDEAPRLTVARVKGHQVVVRLRNSAGGCARADGAMGARLYVAVGIEPPTSIREWTYVKHATRSLARVDFPQTLAPQTQVWITAEWTTRTGKSGPLANPVSAYLQRGGVAEPTTLKIAA